MTKKIHKKPVGTIGPIRLCAAGAEFHKVRFPDTKDEIEALIVQAFASEIMPDGLMITNVDQNAENDFDFFLKTTDGNKYLELIEVAPLENLRGSYKVAPSTYKPYDFAAYILSKVLSKSVRYRGAKKSGIVLLIYITHWSFTLSESVITLLQYWLTTQSHSFERIYCYQPIDPASGVRHLVFPTPLDHWSTFVPDAFKDKLVHNLSPLLWNPMPHTL
ncbi:MAG: hypothetical protein IT507_14100 [Burkholderiaceae bacterium]|nr:hypothetical protein [Burkholderiaceae bacterium]